MDNKLENLYDVVVIGGGSAGLTAAIYLARARYRVLVVEKENWGGQITITSEIVNYPGVEKTSGKELTETMRRQAESFGAEFMSAEVTSLNMNGDIKTVSTSRGELKCFGVLLATGAHPRMIGFKGEAEFRGRGVAYCATCDGEFFTGMDVFVVGGGFAAAEESVFLTKYAKHVTILVREDDFTCAKSTADAARANKNITVLTNTEVEEVAGDSMLRSLRYKNNVTGEVTEYKAKDGETFGVFVFAGYVPATELVKGIAEIDKYGYVITDSNHYTGVEGLYAAGDVCVKNLRQVVTAVGDGAITATEMEKYAAAMQEKTGLKPQPPVSRVPKNEPESKAQESSDGVFTDDMKVQLNTIFEKMAQPMLLKLYLDERPVSLELKGYMESLAELTDKIAVEIVKDGDEVKDVPCVQVCRKDGEFTGLAFHGVPGGHEFTSFMLGLYNAAGPGQAVEPEIMEDIKKINKPVDIKIFVSLSCTMCPDLVVASQRIAAENANIKTEVYDLNHFPRFREQYKVMSVPCMVVNDEDVSFGKKNIRQVVDMIK